MTEASLLPRNASKLEHSLSLASDYWPKVTDPIDAIRGTKIIAPFPAMLPFLIYEYGLGELTPYVPNLYQLIADGIDWQRVRGSYAAMAMALGWLTYSADIEPEDTARRHWNLFQLELDRIRDVRADLDRIAGVATLSVPKRSVFWRGFHGYDVRPLAYGFKSWGDSHFGEYSGVRLRAGAPLWSFGRSHSADVTMSETDLTALGVWIEPSADADLDWGDIAWDETEAVWLSDAVRIRAEAMSAGVHGRPVWVQLRDEDGEIIGYRRARASHYVNPDIAGEYEVDGGRFRVSASPAPILYIEALTGFGDGDGATVATASLVFDAQPLAGVKPGKLWLQPAEIGPGSAAVCQSNVTIMLGESIRERFQFLLRF